MPKIELPSEEIMRQMAKLAIEQATTYFAQMAREFSEALPEDISGKEALDAFANAIAKMEEPTEPWDNTG